MAEEGRPRISCAGFRQRDVTTSDCHPAEGDDLDVGQTTSRRWIKAFVCDPRVAAGRLPPHRPHPAPVRASAGEAVRQYASKLNDQEAGLAQWAHGPANRSCLALIHSNISALVTDRLARSPCRAAHSGSLHVARWHAAYTIPHRPAAAGGQVATSGDEEVHCTTRTLGRLRIGRSV
jgi:hypothetical protein